MRKQQPILCNEEAPDDYLQFMNIVTEPNNQNNTPVNRTQVKQSLMDVADVANLKLNSVHQIHAQGQPSLVQFFHIRHFVKKMMKYKCYLTQFTADQYRSINDHGSVLDLELIKSKASQMKPLVATIMIQQSVIYTWMKAQIDSFLNLWDSVLDRLPLIDPDSQVKVYWDCLLLLPRVYFMIIIPIDLSWVENSFLYGTCLIYTSISLVLLILDVIFRLFQSFYHGGQLVKSRYDILLHVITRAAGVELASLVIQIVFYSQVVFAGAQLNVNDQPYNILLLLACVQHYNINAMRQQLEDTLNLSKAKLSVIELMKLLFLVCYVIHLFACLWFWVGTYSDMYIGTSWVNNTNRNITNMTFGEQYLYSFYYSTVTMFTVGYGDITPQSYPELIVSIVFMMVCSVQLSYSVNTIGGIIDRISATHQEKQKAFHIINQYMQKNRISPQLQYQIRDYINYYVTESQNQATEEENEIIEKLSTNLKNQLITEANSVMINSLAIFREFGPKFIKQIIQQIKTITLPPESVIDFTKMTKHKTNNLCLCFVQSGKISVYVENINTKSELSKLGNVEVGQAFGLNQFIVDQQGIEKYKTQGFTKLLYLSRRDFMKTLDEFDEEKQKFRLIYDRIMQKQDPYFANHCVQCGSRQHPSIQCHMTHFKPDRELIVKITQCNQDQLRKAHKRKELRTITLQKLYPQSEIDLLTQTIQQHYWKEASIYDEEEVEEKHSKKKHRKQESSAAKFKNIKQQNIQSFIDIPELQVSVVKINEDRLQKSHVQLLPMPTVKHVRNNSSRSHFQIPQQYQKMNKLKLMASVINIAQFWQKIGEKRNIVTENQIKEVHLNALMNRFKKKHYLSESVQKDMEILQLSLANQLKQKYEEEEFDISQDYIYYDQSSNKLNVISATRISVYQKINKTIMDFRMKLARTMFYPQIYIERYKPEYIKNIVRPDIITRTPEKQPIPVHATKSLTILKKINSQKELMDRRRSRMV